VHYLCDGLKLHSYPLASLANSRSRVDLSPDGAAAWVFRHSLDVLKWDSGDRVVITLGNVWASFDTDDLSRCKLYCILEGVPEDFWKRTDDNTDCLRWILSYFLLPMYVSPHCRTQKLSLCIKWRYCLSYFIMSAMAFGYFSASNRRKGYHFCLRSKVRRIKWHYVSLFSIFAAYIQNWLNYSAVCWQNLGWVRLMITRLSAENVSR